MRIYRRSDVGGGDDDLAHPPSATFTGAGDSGARRALSG